MSLTDVSRDDFVALLEALDVGLALWRLPDVSQPARLELEWANAAAGRVMGTELRRHTGRLWPELQTAVPLDRIAACGEVARTGGSLAREPIARPSIDQLADTRFWLSATPLLPRRVATVFERDVNTPEESREIRGLTTFLESIIENMPAMVFVKDAANLRFVRFNRVGEALLGMERGQLIGRSDYDFFPRDQADAFTSKDREVLRGREVVDIAEEPIQTAGGERWLHTKKIPVLGDDGDPRYLLGISYDITAARQTQAALRAAHEELEVRVADRTAKLATANAALEKQIADRIQAEAALRDAEDRFRQAQKMEAVGRLAGGIAHDFNNLMSVVVGYATMLAEDLPRGDRRRGDLEQIQRAGERAAALTRQLLAFSRQQVLAPRVVDLNTVVRSMSPMIARLVGEDVVVTTRLDPALQPVRVDPNQIEQVVMNLVVNARDAMPDGGTLTLETSTVVRPRLTGDDAPRVMLAVADDGQGIPPEIQARIFEPFFTTKEVGKGTGLGLSTVFGIVQQSGGVIDLVSAPGAGARFELLFPPAEGAADVAAAISGRPEGRETVLLVEDDEMGRALARRMLERLGYRVCEATGAVEAMDVLRAEPRVDLLLTDVVMPRVGGLELARQAASERPRLGVVFMSGYSEESVARHGLPDERVEFVQKPLTSEALASALRRVLDRDRAR